MRANAGKPRPSFRGDAKHRTRNLVRLPPTQWFPSLARADEFLERNQRDLGRPVLGKKIFRFTCRANHPYKLAPSHPARGADRDRHETRDGMRWTRRQRKTNAAGRVRQSRVVLTPQWLASSWRSKLRKRRRQQSPILRGERVISRKAIAQGRPDASAEPVCSCAVSFVSVRARDRGCSAHPVFPAPSCFAEGQDSSMARALRAARS